MRIGLQIPRFTWSGGTPSIGPTLAEIARAADEAGFSSLWVMDHLFQIRNVGAPEEPMLECYSALSYLAGITHRVRLGAMVTAAVYRYPGMLIKAVSTLDVLSGGRAYLGIGAAWNEVEARGLGIPFPPLKTRFEQLEEVLQIAKQMWTGPVAPYQGRHYQLAQTLNSPQPLSQPHPSILIGGSGEKKTLRLVAQYADACNLFAALGPDVLRAKLDVLRRHCDAVGRDYDSIERTALGVVRLVPGGQSPADVVATCRELAAAGIQHFIFSLPNVSEIKPLELLGREVLPGVAEL